MPTPSELREGARLTRQAAADESAPPLKRLLSRHASALAALAEKIESEEALQNLPLNQR